MVNCHRGIGRVAVVFLWGVSVVLVWRLGAVARAAPVAQLPGTVVINEIAWGGTAASASDEWIELYNTTSLPVDLTGWVITSTGTLNIPLDGKTIAPNGYFLIERTDDNTVSDVAADVTASFGRGLSNSGTGLVLSAGGVTVDTANITGGAWPAGSGSPGYFTMARLDPLAPDTPANWTSNNGLYRNGSDAGGNPINGTPGQPNNSGLPPTPTLTPTETATPAPSPTETATPEPTLTATPLPTPPPDLLISEVLYDGTTSATEGDEFAEICNAGAAAANLTGVKLGDEESPGGGEGMFRLPDGMTLPPGGCLVIAKNSADFTARFGTPPDFEVSQLEKYSAWGSGSWSLANDGDELLLLGPSDEILDSVAYRNGDYAAAGLSGDASASAPLSLQRVWPFDSNSMPADFIHAAPNPGTLTLPPPPPADVPLAANLPDGMHAFWGHLHAHTTYSDGSGPPRYALAVARAAGLHFYALTDHGWRLDDVQWADVLSRTAEATIPGQFVAFGGTEWSHPTAGHLTILNSTVRVNKEHPLLADLPALYTWLATNPAVVAQFNHPDPARGGNFNDFAPNSGAANNVALQEIGNNAQQYTTYETAFLQSNFRGWRVAPTINGDTHTPNWGSDLPARTGIVAPQLSRNALLDAIRARRVFATEDSNFALALRANGRWMGSVLTGTGAVSISVTAVDPDAEPATLALYDRNLQLAETTIHGPAAEWQFTIEARPGHFYWVKAVQADGDRAYSAPVWVEGQAEPERVIFSEILPAPIDVDWDGDGVADYHDEWIELRNSSAQTVGLGGWQVRDSSGAAYVLPLNTTLPPGGFITLYYTQTGISLNNSGDSLALIDPAGAVADTLTFDHTPGYDESWCLLESWSDNCAPSPGDANREIPPAEPLQVNIFEAKRLSYNAWVQVKGTVTAPPGIFGARQMYIQDDSSGILVYLPKDFWRTLNLGDRVRVTGNLRSYHQEFEIVVDEPADVKVRGAGVAPPPLPLATTSLLEPYEGLLVQLQGQAVQFRRNTFWVDDGTDPAKVTIRRSTGIRKPYIPAGAAVTVVGIVSQYSDKNPTRTDYRLLPRYPTDLVVPQPAPPPVPENWPSLLPDTGYR